MPRGPSMAMLRPQLHTHAVIFNMTERENGLENAKQMRALQPHEMFVSQRYATAVYRSELALRLEKLGYELERGKHGPQLAVCNFQLVGRRGREHRGRWAAVLEDGRWSRGRA